MAPGKPDDARSCVRTACEGEGDVASDEKADVLGGPHVRTGPASAVREGTAGAGGTDFGREPAREPGPTSGKPRWWWCEIKSPPRRESLNNVRQTFRSAPCTRVL
jgi:hypothetical protein